MQSGRLDDIDLKLLELIQPEGRIKLNELAKSVNMSIPSVSDRLRRMEDEGFIEGYYAKISPQRMGFHVMAFVVVDMESSVFDHQIVEQTESEDQILECHAITGAGSHILKVLTENTEGLEKLLGKIRSWSGVKNTRTSVVLSTPKSSPILPLHYYEPNHTRNKREK